MERKQFLITSGMLISSALLSYAIEPPLDNQEENVKLRRPNPNCFKEPILKAITLGLNAPNPHNTQAWKFKILNDYESILYVDEKRILPATDPTTRQIHIGCGSFAALFKIGACSLGYGASVNYLPEGSYCFADTGKKPVALLALEKERQVADPLVKFIYERQTNRNLYYGNFLTAFEFDKIIQSTRPAYAQLKLINSNDEMKPLLEILYRGMETECYDWNSYDESRQWFRVKDDIAAQRDGINLRHQFTGIKRWVVETFFSGYSKKLWHNESAINDFLKSYHKVMMSSKGVVTFTTETNELLDWLKTGEDYARFQLAATAQGFCTQPLSQVLQEFPKMRKSFDEFNEYMKISTPQKVQMVLRIGRGNPVEYSYRRNTGALEMKSNQSAQLDQSNAANGIRGLAH